MQSVTPECTHSGLGSSSFARRYSRNRVFFLFLWLLRCFSSPGSLHYTMDSCNDDCLTSRVSPFGYLRIVGYLLLPEAFRSLSRLSSALSAKASTLRSSSLDLLTCIALHMSGSGFLLWLYVYKFFATFVAFSDLLPLKITSSDVYLV